ncbi:hypothetical protein Hamer_G029460 [Homarus americanus]|uniref:Uncharacterized protein n=1 Tax=Homarus americanus TaxID=6706 RepID=A0A8J5JYP4_HOMAM|nr:hypothetical protein Hamer_G029460 [Homarus americanus]
MRSVKAGNSSGTHFNVK